jgi:hypothetical protein
VGWGLVVVGCLDDDGSGKPLRGGHAHSQLGAGGGGSYYARRFCMAGGTAKRPSTEMYEWRITRIRSTPATLIGHVEAPDAEQAIKEAIRLFGIADPEQHKRLAARA